MNKRRRKRKLKKSVKITLVLLLVIGLLSYPTYKLLTKDGKLKLMTNATANEALAAGVNDAMIFGPFLIVNGKPLEIVGDPWGQAPRVAIGQTKDGIILFLVVDGENYINGASLQDMVDVLQKYGAYNAANLDGGQSSSLVVNNKLYNNPPPAAKRQGGRYVVTGWGLID